VRVLPRTPRAPASLRLGRSAVLHRRPARCMTSRAMYNGVSHSGVVAAIVAAAILANSGTWSAAVAQQAGSVVQERDEATIAHQHLRIQDHLRPSVVQDKKKMQTELDAAKEIVEKAREQNLPRVLSGASDGRAF
jgi:hypothetical protein